MQDFFSSRFIANATGLDARKVRKRAILEFWPARTMGTRVEYAPPAELLAACQTLARQCDFSPVDFRISDRDRAEFRRITTRFDALCELDRLIVSGTGVERALKVAAIQFKSSPSQLRVWSANFARNGIAGLIENKLGRVGRKPEGVGRV